MQKLYGSGFGAKNGEAKYEEIMKKVLNYERMRESLLCIFHIDKGVFLLYNYIIGKKY